MMPTESRDKAIKLLVAKFIKLVESLEPGERLSIKKVGARKAKAGKKSIPTGKKPDTPAKSPSARAKKTKAPARHGK
jgi:hypothetical protein